MRKNKYFTLILFFILLFAPSVSYATQNNSRTEDKQIITIEISDQKQSQFSGNTLPKTGEAITNYTLFGFLIVITAVILFLVKKERRTDE